MDSKSSKHCPSSAVQRNPIWKLKHERDCEQLKKKLESKLVENIISLYDQSQFANLEIKTRTGRILCHSSIVSSRCNLFWSLLKKIAKLLPENSQNTEIFSVTLQEVDFYVLETFVRSLYTSSIDVNSWRILCDQLKRNLPSPPQNAFVIEKLDSREEFQISSFIAEQLKKGSISQSKGNLKDVSHLFQVPSRTGSPSNASSKQPKNPEASPHSDVPEGKDLHKMSFHGNSETTSTVVNGVASAEARNQVKESKGKLKTSSALWEGRSTDAAHEAAEDSGAGDTSSLEVEMPNSEEDRSLSIDSTTNSNEQPENFPEDEMPLNQDPHKPLTRTRTFEIINVTNPECPENNKTLNIVSGDTAHQEIVHDPPDLRELERKKGSLIFENNFQTFSNIPSTNMMSMSLGSEGSFGVSSVHSSMLSSLGSSDVSSSAVIRGDPHSMTSENDLSSMSLTQSITVKETAQVSQSPDSLAIDCSQNPNKMNSSHKEEFSFEEKEKDDKESTCPSDVSRTEVVQEEQKEISGEFGREVPVQRQTSAGSVKDVDSIPVVTGYVSSPTSEKVRRSSEGDKSMFSMFINLDEIPSPVKEEPVKPEVVKPQPSGVYMFIEADTLSPKVRRKCPLAAKEPSSSRGSDSEKLPTATRKEPLPPEKEEVTKTSDKNEDKKSFFVFIEADNVSGKNSPKPTRRCPLKRKSKDTVMSKSAPTDSLLFGPMNSTSKSSTPDNSNLKMMTKSVIDRDEFISQPPARRNVSVNDKINESSKIPRLIANFHSKLSLTKEPPSNKSDMSSEKSSSKSNLFTALDFPEAKKKSKRERQKKRSDDFIDLPFEVTETEDPSSTSDVSSLLSSLDRCSENTEEGRRRNQENLGDDLLKMLLNEINTDVTIQVSDKKIKAHKCILASRCVYFAAMLSGHWVESAGNVIKLQGFSHEAVMIALKHIYSGTSHIPPTAKVEELAAISDMLVLDGLKEAVALHFKANQCHYFHKPCADCLLGVLEVLPLAGAFCMEDLFRRCLKWIAKHFCIIFPTRGFANLIPELQDRCVKQIIDDLSVSTVLDAAIGCDRVLCLIPAVKWSQPISDLTGYLFDSIIDFVSSNLSNVMASDRFLAMGRDGGWSIDKLEETLCLSMKSIKPDQAILSHIQVTLLLESPLPVNAPEFSENFIAMLEKILRRLEKFLIHNANRVCVSRKWPLLPSTTQKRIKDASVLVFDGSKSLASRPKFSSASRLRDLEPTSRARASSMNDQRLTKSSSSAMSHKAPNKKLKSTADRCQTPPAPNMKPMLQTPLATRTSLLRAQAAIQRSQSARSVADRSRKPSKPSHHDGVTEDELSESSKTYSRGGTFTRSLSKNEQLPNRSRTPIRHNNAKNKMAPSKQSQLPIATCRSESHMKHLGGHKRNFSGPQIGQSQKVNGEVESGRTYSLGNQNRPHAGLPSVSCIPKLSSASSHPTRLPAKEKYSTNHNGSFSGLEGEDSQNDENDDDEGVLWSVNQISTPPKLSRSNTFSKEPTC